MISHSNPASRLDPCVSPWRPLLEQVALGPRSRTNALVEGAVSCCYQDVPAVLERIHRLFLEQQVSRRDCFLLECGNSLADALALLYLLCYGWSFVVFSKSSGSSNGSSLGPNTLTFCRYRVATKPATQDADLHEPTRFLSLRMHESWNARGVSEAVPKVYLRTSGSSGDAKLAAHSHDKLLANAQNCVQRLGLLDSDRIAIPVPISHMYGLGAAFLSGIMVGASIDLQPAANFLRFLERERAFRPSVSFITPSFGETLLHSKSRRKVRLTVVAGDRIREGQFSRLETLLGPVVQLYGSTEMGAIAAAEPHDPVPVRAKTVGVPMKGVELRVALAETPAADSLAATGELQCRHANGFVGYFDRHGNAVLPDAVGLSDWYATSDLGRISPDNRVEVLGRCDNSIKRNGVLVQFSELEERLETIPGVRRAVVVSGEEMARGKSLVAYCQLGPDAILGEREIRSTCFGMLPRHAVPDRVILVPSFPVLPSGKIDRINLVRHLPADTK